MKIIRTAFSALIAIIFLTAGCATQTQGREPLPENKSFSIAQIEQLVAPIALYPDALIAQILIAATYPLEVIQAARWLRQNPGLADDALQNALQYEDWDPSIKSLIKAPAILERMDKELNWTEDLGNAFLMQQDAVMDTVQIMRMRARSVGNLESTPYQSVIEKDRVIYITPSRPNIVYVPEYNPTVVFANWSYPRIYYPSLFVSTPQIYWQEPGRQTFGLITFGLGIAVGSILTNHIDWDQRNIIINEQHNYYPGQQVENVNVTPFQEWHHDPRHRHIRYPNQFLENNYRPESSSESLPQANPPPAPVPLHSPPRIESAPPLTKEEQRWRQTINSPIVTPFVSKEDSGRVNPVLNPPANSLNSPLPTPFMSKDTRNIIHSPPRVTSQPLESNKLPVFAIKEDISRVNPVLNPPANSLNSPLPTTFVNKDTRNIIHSPPRIAQPLGNNKLPIFATKEDISRVNPVLNPPANSLNSPLPTPFVNKDTHNIIRATPRTESQPSGSNKENRILQNRQRENESPAMPPRTFSPRIYATQPFPDPPRSKMPQSSSVESNKPRIYQPLRSIPDFSASRSESRKEHRNDN